MIFDFQPSSPSASKIQPARVPSSFLPPRSCTISVPRLLPVLRPHPYRKTAVAFAAPRHLKLVELRFQTTAATAATAGHMPSPLTRDQVSSPVPRDIEISQSLEGSLSHISNVGEACGILESELEPYGRFKAKVGDTPVGRNSVSRLAEHSLVVSQALCTAPHTSALERGSTSNEQAPGGWFQATSARSATTRPLPPPPPAAVRVHLHAHTLARTWQTHVHITEFVSLPSSCTPCLLAWATDSGVNGAEGIRP